MIAAVHSWVEKGGSLFLIVDHPPFPAAASDLAKAFGVEFNNGRATAGHWKEGTDTFEHGTGLKESIITRGRPDDEKVTKVSNLHRIGVQTQVTLAPVRLVAGNGWDQKRSARIGRPREQAKVLPENGLF